MFSLRKKKEEPIDLSYGFVADNQPTSVLLSRGLVCALKGLIIYAAVVGSIGGVISSFSLPCHPLVIFSVLFIMAMGLAFMHYNHLLFNLCYPVLFFAFTYCIFSFRYQVNSGFQAFINILQNAYSKFFNLSILREGTESIADRSLTITFAAIFIGFFLLILLNIAVSEYMSLLAVILLTFPIFQLGIYIRYMPDFQYFILLLFAYFMVGILKRSNHFQLPYKDKKKTEFLLKNKKNVITHSYHASGKIMLELTALFMALSVVLGVLCLPLLSDHSSYAPSPIRKKADEYMQIFVQSGLSGFFNRYPAKGGLGEGNLGGVSSIRPDYQTDLTLTFVPVSTQMIYLKAYVGSNYTGSSWEAPDYDLSNLQETFSYDFDKFEASNAFLESNRLKYYMDNTPNKGMYAKMKIENVDASSYLYLPYYTDQDISTEYNIDHFNIYGPNPPGETVTLSYYPLIKKYWEIPVSPDQMLAHYPKNSREYNYIQYYNIYNMTHYNDIPSSLLSYLDTIKPEIGYGADIDEQIFLIQKYFRENFTYSMSPGSTPYKEDYIQYFLEKQKRGFCAHFASAATMLLRSYGIPARYVEGYAVSSSDVAEGEVLDEPIEEWFTGENPLGQSAVVKVNVLDANAHAWVEVYKNGFGWVPYEFTPPSDDEEETAYSDFWSIFSRLFPSSVNSNQNNDSSQEEYEAPQPKKLNQIIGRSFFKPLFFFLLLLITVLICMHAFKELYKRYVMNQKYKNGNYSDLLAFYYQKAAQAIVRKGYCNEVPLLWDIVPLTQDVILAESKPKVTVDELSDMLDMYQRACFSQEGVSKAEADQLLRFLKGLGRKLPVKKVPRSNRK